VIIDSAGKVSGPWKKCGEPIDDNILFLRIMLPIVSGDRR